jgi:hypothetical protein
MGSYDPIRTFAVAQMPLGYPVCLGAQEVLTENSMALGRLLINPAETCQKRWPSTRDSRKRCEIETISRLFSPIIHLGAAISCPPTRDSSGPRQRRRGPQ